MEATTHAAQPVRPGADDPTTVRCAPIDGATDMGAGEDYVIVSVVSGEIIRGQGAHRRNGL